MATASKETPKAMDVAKPGKVLPDSSARPVIITHRPMVQDPMVKADDKTDDGPDTKTPDSSIKISSGTHGDKVIKPVSESLKAPETNEEIDPKPETSVADDTPESKEDASAEAAVVEAVADQAEVSVSKRDGKPTEEDKAKAEHLKKLIASKTYFLPVGQVARRRNRRMSVVLLLLIMLAAGAYLAIDAKVILGNVKLPIELIKN
ncbi:MAG TPA: hypothetical protein VM124_01820 [Candidatus Limnocylindrales bacterium]|nr:hypothetical protein [Candidatus Limnocylindrales bacterium]